MSSAATVEFEASLTLLAADALAFTKPLTELRRKVIVDALREAARGGVTEEREAYWLDRMISVGCDVTAPFREDGWANDGFGIWDKAAAALSPLPYRTGAVTEAAAPRARFFLGSPEAGWLARAGVPLFVSRTRLIRRPTGRPRAVAPWALDSGAFSEIKANGRWTIDAAAYAEFVVDAIERVGLEPEFVAPQDWMVEPEMIARTGLTAQRGADRRRRLRLQAVRLARG